MTDSENLSPTLSVIIPVFEDAESLRQCLSALAIQQCPPAFKFEVVVCDNGSSDDVGGATNGFDFVRLVREDRPGSYVARNTAVRVARGAVLAFTDSDCVPSPEWVHSAARSVDFGESTDIVVGDIELFDSTATPRKSGRSGVAAYEIATAFRQRYYAEKLQFGPTANLVVSANVFNGLGGFAEDRRSGGDKEFGRRAASRDFRVRFDPSVRVAHPVRPDLGSLEHKIRRVVGGEHVAARGRPVRHVVDFARYLILRPIKAALQVMRCDQLEASERIKALLVVVRVAAWQVGERIQLFRGGQPRR